MPEFDKNAAYIWAIFAIGLAVPVALTVYACLRTRTAKRRLERLQASETP